MRAIRWCIVVVPVLVCAAVASVGMAAFNVASRIADALMDWEEGREDDPDGPLDD